jgi:hypothetical protein
VKVIRINEEFTSDLHRQRPDSEEELRLGSVLDSRLPILLHLPTLPALAKWGGCADPPRCIIVTLAAML